MWHIAEGTTPGEWYIPAEDANHARHFVIRVKPDSDPKLNQLGFFLVADVYGQTDEEALANARFIIAAAGQYRPLATPNVKQQALEALDRLAARFPESTGTNYHFDIALIRKELEK